MEINTPSPHIFYYTIEQLSSSIICISLACFIVVFICFFNQNTAFKKNCKTNLNTSIQFLRLVATLVLRLVRLTTTSFCCWKHCTFHSSRTFKGIALIWIKIWTDLHILLHLICLRWYPFFLFRIYWEIVFPLILIIFSNIFLAILKAPFIQQNRQICDNIFSAIYSSY